MAFTLEDTSNYKVNSYVFNLGGDWQTSDKLKLNGSYTWSQSSADVASGIVFTRLQDATGTVDSVIDNTLHALSLGEEPDFEPSELQVYPAGAVTLSLPIELPPGDEWLEDQIAVTYMACSPTLCKPPVEGKILKVRIPGVDIADTR